jgi:hypothetical protein
MRFMWVRINMCLALVYLMMVLFVVPPYFIFALCGDIFPVGSFTMCVMLRFVVLLIVVCCFFGRAIYYAVMKVSEVEGPA